MVQILHTFYNKCDVFKGFFIIFKKYILLYNAIFAYIQRTKCMNAVKGNTLNCNWIDRNIFQVCI